ncbi:29540_t:CDS:2, partial [Gigaspora margarita]
QSTKSGKKQTQERKKVQSTILVQERKESPNDQSRKSKASIPAKNEHEEGKKVQFTNPSEEQTQKRKKSPNHHFREVQAQERKESPYRQS